MQIFFALPLEFNVTLIKIIIVNYTTTRRWFSQCKNRKKHELCRWTTRRKTLMSTFTKIFDRWFYVVFFVKVRGVVQSCQVVAPWDLIIKCGNIADDIYVYLPSTELFRNTMRKKILWNWILKFINECKIWWI